MPDLSLPELHLPDLKLPDGLRDFNRHDLQNAIGDRLPRKADMPDVDLAKAVEDRLGKIEKAINKIDLPKAIEDRLPGRKRTNPILPLAALVAIGSMIAAAWWLITSPGATTRVRETADRLRAKVTGQETGLVRYDDDQDLGSLLPDPHQTRPTVEAETWPDTFSDLGDTVKAGNGSTTERTASV